MYLWTQLLILITKHAGIVGELSQNGDAYIWTHKKIEIGYNGNQIVDVNLTSESKAKLTPNTKLTFTYEVEYFVFRTFKVAVGAIT